MGLDGSIRKAEPVNPLLTVAIWLSISCGSGKRVHAVSGVSFHVNAGETLGLVGESGCGKSSLGRALMQAPPPSSGSVCFDGLELTTQRGQALRRLRPRLQLVLQDPIAALNPRRWISEIVAEPLEIWSKDDKSRRPALWPGLSRRWGWTSRTWDIAALSSSPGGNASGST